MATHRGRIWVMGGTGISEKNHTETWIFDPDAVSWSRGPQLPCSLSWGAAWSLRGTLLAISGGRWDDDQGTHVFETRSFVLEGEAPERSGSD